jgi:lambda family phage minor tail protein L
MYEESRLAQLGKKQITQSLSEFEPNSILEFFELYFEVDSEPFRFHAGTNNLTKDVIWNGNVYYATAIDVEGFETNIIGRFPRPKVTIANSELIVSNILRDYSDLRNSKFVRIKTFLRHLDDINFDESINPFGQSNPYAYISKEKYLISQKIMENKQLIQFELIVPFDLESLNSATRGIYGRYCYWQYRGAGCNYDGNPVAKEDDSSLPTNIPLVQVKNSNGDFILGSLDATLEFFKWKENKYYDRGDYIYIDNMDLNGLKDPPRTWFVCETSHLSSKFITASNKTYWSKDGCSKTISACKKRFSSILPFGGFPGTDAFGYGR